MKFSLMLKEFLRKQDVVNVNIYDLQAVISKPNV